MEEQNLASNSNGMILLVSSHIDKIKQKLEELLEKKTFSFQRGIAVKEDRIINTTSFIRDLQVVSIDVFQDGKETIAEIVTNKETFEIKGKIGFKTPILNFQRNSVWISNFRDSESKDSKPNEIIVFKI